MGNFLEGFQYVVGLAVIGAIAAIGSSIYGIIWLLHHLRIVFI